MLLMIKTLKSLKIGDVVTADKVTMMTVTNLPGTRRKRLCADFGAVRTFAKPSASGMPLFKVAQPVWETKDFGAVRIHSKVTQ